MHVNIQCLSNKINALELILDDYQPMVFCISEHWLNDIQTDNLQISNYSMVAKFCRNITIHGGTLILVQDKYVDLCKALNVSTYCKELSFECSLVIYNKNTCIVCIYRSPSSDIAQFFDHFNELLNKIVGKYENIFITGDLNIDNLNVKNCNRKKLYDLLNSYRLTSMIDKPTRISINNGIKCVTGLDYLYLT